VHWAPGIPCALDFFRGGRFLHPSGAPRREIAEAWLAWLFEIYPNRHHPRRRVIQYSETLVTESKSRGVLDTPLARGMTRRSEAPREYEAVFEISKPSLRAAKRRSNPFFLSAARWIASRSLSSGARSRDPLARNDGIRIGCLKSEVDISGAPTRLARIDSALPGDPSPRPPVAGVLRDIAVPGLLADVVFFVVAMASGGVGGNLGRAAGSLVAPVVLGNRPDGFLPGHPQPPLPMRKR
jgi:hypothetical protein